MAIPVNVTNRAVPKRRNGNCLASSRIVSGDSPQIKNAAENSAADFIAGTSDSALNLVGAEASGTCVNMAGSSVNDSLNALDVGLPCTIGTSVGVRNLDTKGYALTTKITLSHSLHLPSFYYSVIHALSQALRYDNKLSGKMQALFSKFFVFFKIY